MFPSQRIERANRRHGKRSGDERGRLVVRELDQRPLIEQVGAKVLDDQHAAAIDRVARPGVA